MCLLTDATFGQKLLAGFGYGFSAAAFGMAVIGIWIARSPTRLRSDRGMDITFVLIALGSAALSLYLTGSILEMTGCR